MSTSFRPGKNKEVNWNFLTPEENNILASFIKKDWYATRLEVSPLESDTEFSVVFLKPSPRIRELFGISRELLVAFSPYRDLEPRALRITDDLEVDKLRCEEICSIIISKDKNIEAETLQILKSNEESKVIVPFYYGELISEVGDEFINERIKKHFYSRDLFGIQDPLQKSRYFFGRRDVVSLLANNSSHNINSGIFGLRKTGKTSILFSLIRSINKRKFIPLYVECQSMHNKHWTSALFTLIDELKLNHSIKAETHQLSDYRNEEFSKDYFYRDLQEISRKTKKSILFIFDEIEHLTFDTSTTESWKNGTSYLNFWQGIRSAFNKGKINNLFSFIIAGTNPKSIETPRVNGTDNPIFQQVTSMYVPPFSFDHTSEMLKKLGGYMGLKFDDLVVAEITSKFGGHPLLIRQMCSYLHKNINNKRPYEVKPVDFNELYPKFIEFEPNFKKYADLTLIVLDEWYKDERYMLDLLSLGNIEEFKELANESPEYVSHLLSYGIIDKSDNGHFSIKIESIRNRLESINKYKKINLSRDEKISEMNKRRDKIEINLRKLVRVQLKMKYGTPTAKEKIAKELFGGKEYKKHLHKDYNDFFKPSIKKLYYRSIFNIIEKEYNELFINLFLDDIDTFKAKTTILSKFRNKETHADEISESDFMTFRGVAKWMEDALEI